MVAPVTRPVLRRVLVAVAALLVAWIAVPSAVPIYDGIGNPDQPYRYVQPPAGAKKTPAPTVASTTIPVDPQQLSRSGYSNSAEIGPQVVYFVPAGALKAPAGATSIRITETPLAPAPPTPADGRIVGNVYRVTATTSQGDAVVVGRGIERTPTLDLRAPSAKQPGPVFEHLTAGVWKQSATLRIGQDIYQTSAGSLGDWALVQLTKAPAMSSSSGGGVNVGLLVGGIAVLLLVAAIVAIRVARTRRTA
jgi:hypothetical protein